MARKVLDCRNYPSERNCTITIAADTADELLEVAVMHATHTHGHEDTPELRRQLREGITEAAVA